WVEDDVLQYRAEHLRCAINVRLAFRREVDHLRVATALEVENSIGRPPVFVVTDETAIGIGRKRRLASSRKAEKERGVAGLADIRRAVHREHVLLWEQIIH